MRRIDSGIDDRYCSRAGDVVVCLSTWQSDNGARRLVNVAVYDRHTEVVDGRGIRKSTGGRRTRALRRTGGLSHTKGLCRTGDLHHFQQGVYLCIRDRRLRVENQEKELRIKEIRRSDQKNLTQTAVKAAGYIAA